MGDGFKAARVDTTLLVSEANWSRSQLVTLNNRLELVKTLNYNYRFDSYKSTLLAHVLRFQSSLIRQSAAGMVFGVVGGSAFVPPSFAKDRPQARMASVVIDNV